MDFSRISGDTIAIDCVLMSLHDLSVEPEIPNDDVMVLGGEALGKGLDHNSRTLRNGSSAFVRRDTEEGSLSAT